MRRELPPERRMAGLVTLLERIRHTQVQQMTLGTADLRILWMLSDDRPRTLKEIAEELRLEQSTVNRQMNAAMGEGFLLRRRRAGSTAHEFLRSAEGVRVYEEDIAKSLTALGIGLESLGEDTEGFLALLTRFIDAFDGAVRSAGEETEGSGGSVR